MMTHSSTLFLLLLAVLFVSIVGFQLLGHHVGVHWRARGLKVMGDGTAAIEGSVFALFGLLVAFTISGGEARLDARRHLIVHEANAVETAYLRLDLLPQADQPRLRDSFRRYVDARLAFYSDIRHADQAKADRRHAVELQQQIWREASTAAMGVQDTRATLVLLPAINEMIHVTTERDAALRTHVPFALFVLLIAFSFACAFFAGVGMSKMPRPSPLHVLLFAATLSLTAYVIINIEFPRFGFIRLGPIDALLAEVRQRMG
jgi:hypothetical protein